MIGENPHRPPAADRAVEIHAQGSDRLLVSRIILPRPIDEVFAFFADAFNLERITPPWLRFRIRTPPPIDMRVGALIDYSLRVRAIPVRWRTRIGEWDPPRRFTDEQIRGPYRLWRHTHEFTSVEGGALCVDRVLFRAPLPRLTHALLVEPDVRRIFRFRANALRRLFENEAASTSDATPLVTSQTPSRGSA